MITVEPRYGTATISTENGLDDLRRQVEEYLNNDISTYQNFDLKSVSMATTSRTIDWGYGSVQTIYKWSALIVFTYTVSKKDSPG